MTNWYNEETKCMHGKGRLASVEKIGRMNEWEHVWGMFFVWMCINVFIIYKENANNLDPRAAK